MQVTYQLAVCLVALCLCFAGSLHAENTGRIEFAVTNSKGELTPCRIHLKNSEGKPQFSNHLPSWKDHFVCKGSATIDLEPGHYSWEIERGPEFERLAGTVRLVAGEVIKVDQRLIRLTTLRDEGWYSGDLHVHRVAADVPLLMEAEDLDFAPVIGWWNQPAPSARPFVKTEFLVNDRVYSLGAGEDEREGGALLYFGLKRPLDLSVRSREYPSPMEFVRQSREQNSEVWIDIEKPFWWDTPVWLAVAKPNSIGIAHNHMHRGGVLANEAWGKQRDLRQYPGVWGNGLWTQEIYYHILNCGIRIPPSAGSASGVRPNPVGYNRVYVNLDEAELTRDNWFQALAAGRCFVTNGPLLRVKANGLLPGSELETDGPVTLSLAIDSNDPISRLEVIHNGIVIKRIECPSEQHLELQATCDLRGPGWFLVRAISDVENTFRFASTAPWYVPRADGLPTISQESTQFFLDWIDERIERVERNVADINDRDSILRWHLKAKDFWERRFRLATNELASKRNERWQRTRDRMRKLLKLFEQSRQVAKVQEDLSRASTKVEFEESLEPLVAIDVSINPESRVKVDSRFPRVSLVTGKPSYFLVKVENTAGITAPLNLKAFDMAASPPGLAKWCSVGIVDRAYTSRYLSGAAVEFKAMKISAEVNGLREVRLIGDAGQGTQDLGFRATTDVLLNVEPASSEEH